MSNYRYYDKNRLPDEDAIAEKFDQDVDNWLRQVSRDLRLGEDDSPIRGKFQSMIGSESPPNCLLASNVVERKAGMRSVATALLDLRETKQDELAHLCIFDARTVAAAPSPHIKINIARKCAGILKAAGAHLGVVQIGCLQAPDEYNGNEYIVTTRVDAVTTGVDLRDTLPMIVSRLQRRLECPRGIILPIELPKYAKRLTARTAMAAAASLYDIRDPFGMRLKNSLEQQTHEEWLRGRRKREVERLKIFTLCPMEKLVIANGEIEPAIKSSFAGANARVRQLHRSGDKRLHRDEPIHWWLRHASEAGLGSSPPFVEFR